MSDIGASDLAELRRALEARLSEGRNSHFGAVRADWSAAAAEYFWDEAHQAFRLDILRRHGVAPGRDRVLDMAAGCGQFLLAALDAGFDCHGVEPDPWRVAFVGRKVAFTGRPAAWAGRIVEGIGEHLPFEADSFDHASSFQTLEHVQDPPQVVAELLRVTRPAGTIHVMCPDYRSLFEAHYQVPWLPMFPRVAARAYLRALGRPSLGLDSIRYTTTPRVRGWFEAAARHAGKVIDIEDQNLVRFRDTLARRGLPVLPGAHAAWRTLEVLRGVGRCEISVDLLVRVRSGR